MAEPSPAAPHGVGGGTRTVGIIGWPVERSLSPAIHNAAFAALGLDWIDVPMPVEPDRLPAALEGLRALGFAGANVTMPHKTEAADLADELSEDARRLHAVNTIVVEGGRLLGHNTDAPGFERFLRLDAEVDPKGMHALVFGAGGAARAVALALGRAGATHLTIAARDVERGASIRSLLDDVPTTVQVVPFDAAGAEEPDLIVNATPVGAVGERLPHPELHRGVVVVELLYPAVTPLRQEVERVGGRSFGGLGLLLQQAALSFELWTRLVAPMDAMKTAVTRIATES